MLETFDAKYGPVTGGAIGVAVGIWIVRQQEDTQSVVVFSLPLPPELLAAI